MSHLKRQEVPKKWPIERKGSVYVVSPNFNVGEGIPVLVVLRDMLKLAQNRNEVKKIIHSKQVFVNDKAAGDEKNNILLFDNISIPTMKKYYKMELSEKGKFYLEEIKESESHKKIAKIINKKTLKGKKTQLNFGDGRNLLSDLKCSVNDSVIINFKDKKIEKGLPLKEKVKVIIFAGKHAGEKGEISEINAESKTAKVNTKGKELNILIKQLMVTE